MSWFYIGSIGWRSEDTRVLRLCTLLHTACYTNMARKWLNVLVNAQVRYPIEHGHDMQYLPNRRPCL